MDKQNSSLKSEEFYFLRIPCIYKDGLNVIYSKTLSIILFVKTAFS